MHFLSLLLVGAGFCCLLTGWIFSRSVKRTRQDERLCRGIISKLKKGYSNSDYILTVSFSSPQGLIFHHEQEVRQSPAWYEGMPLLVRYRQDGQNLRVLRVQTYQEAYGKTFGFLMGGMLLIIVGALLL